MEAKPIVVIYLPDFFRFGNERDPSNELMRILNGNWGEPDPKYKLTDYWSQYYWFVFPKSEIREPEFQVFYSKDFTDIQYAELRQILKDAIDTKNQPNE